MPDEAQLFRKTIPPFLDTCLADVAPWLRRQQPEALLANSASKHTNASRAQRDGKIPILLMVPPASKLPPERMAMLAQPRIATGRVRANDPARDLATPTADSMVRLFSAGERTLLLSRLQECAPRSAAPSRRTTTQLVDSAAPELANATVVPPGALPHVTPDAHQVPDNRPVAPGVSRNRFHGALPDDQLAATVLAVNFHRKRHRAKKLHTEAVKCRHRGIHLA
jgi:hypothetical protein